MADTNPKTSPDNDPINLGALQTNMARRVKRAQKAVDEALQAAQIVTPLAVKESAKEHFAVKVTGNIVQTPDDTQKYSLRLGLEVTSDYFDDRAAQVKIAEHLRGSLAPLTEKQGAMKAVYIHVGNNSQPDIVQSEGDDGTKHSTGFIAKKEKGKQSISITLELTHKDLEKLDRWTTAFSQSVIAAVKPANAAATQMGEIPKLLTDVIEEITESAKTENAARQQSDSSDDDFLSMCLTDGQSQRAAREKSGATSPEAVRESKPKGPPGKE